MHKKSKNIFLTIIKKRSWMSLLGGFWGSKTSLEPLGLPRGLQDTKKHPLDQSPSNWWEDFGTILGTKMAPKSIKNRSQNWSKFWLIFGYQKVPIRGPKTSHNRSKIKKMVTKYNLQKIWKSFNSHVPSLVLRVRRVPRWASFCIFSLPKWDQN